MGRNSLRFFQNNDFQVVRGDTLIMPFRFKNFSPLNYDMEMDIIDPYTKQVIVMANGSTYSKKRNPDNREGIYYNTDTNQPSGVVLSSDDEIAVKLDSADTLLFEPNQSYNYQIKVLRASGDLTKTIIRGVIQALRNATDG